MREQDRKGVWEGIHRVIKNTEKREEDILLMDNGKLLDREESAKFLAESFNRKTHRKGKRLTMDASELWQTRP